MSHWPEEKSHPRHQLIHLLKDSDVVRALKEALARTTPDHPPLDREVIERAWVLVVKAAAYVIPDMVGVRESLRRISLINSRAGNIVHASDTLEGIDHPVVNQCRGILVYARALLHTDGLCESGQAEWDDTVKAVHAECVAAGVLLEELLGGKVEAPPAPTPAPTYQERLIVTMEAVERLGDRIDRIDRAVFDCSRRTSERSDCTTLLNIALAHARQIGGDEWHVRNTIGALGTVLVLLGDDKLPNGTQKEWEVAFKHARTWAWSAYGNLKEALRRLPDTPEQPTVDTPERPLPTYDVALLIWQRNRVSEAIGRGPDTVVDNPVVNHAWEGLVQFIDALIDHAVPVGQPLPPPYRPWKGAPQNRNQCWIDYLDSYGGKGLPAEWWRQYNEACQQEGVDPMAEQ